MTNRIAREECLTKIIIPKRGFKQNRKRQMPNKIARESA